MVPTFLSRVVPEWIVWLHCVSVHVVCVCVWHVCSFVGGISVRSAVCSVHGVFVCVWCVRYIGLSVNVHVCQRGSWKSYLGEGGGKVICIRCDHIY